MSHSADGRPRSVLVIDDDPSIRAFLQDVLVLEGFEVRTAEDGIAGLTQIEVQRPDCVVLDLMMPGLDGHAVLREIRTGHDGFQLPVIMLTAACDDGQTWQGWAGGVDCFLPKPLAPSLLLHWLDRLCAVGRSPDRAARDEPGCAAVDTGLASRSSVGG